MFWLLGLDRVPACSLRVCSRNVSGGGGGGSGGVGGGRCGSGGGIGGGIRCCCGGGGGGGVRSSDSYVWSVSLLHASFGWVGRWV